MCSCHGALRRCYRLSVARGEYRLRQVGNCMALSDHVRSQTRRAAALRYGAAAAAQAGPLDFRSSNDNHGPIEDEDRADELDCLRRVLAPELLQRAELRARELGTGAD